MLVEAVAKITHTCQSCKDTIKKNDFFFYKIQRKKIRSKNNTSINKQFKIQYCKRCGTNFQNQNVRFLKYKTKYEFISNE